MTKDELVVAIQRIMDADGTEEELDRLMIAVSQSVPHPAWTDLIYYDKRRLSAMRVAEEALSYRAVRL